MNQYGCIRLIDDLIQYSGPISEGAFDNPYSDVFYQDPTTSIINCSQGFDDRYERPHSQTVQGIPGRYVTGRDIQNFCYIGYMHGMAKVLGWQPHWDSTICGAIGGYPKGSALRNDNGYKMISRIGDNQEPPPAQNADTDYWKLCRPFPLFGNLNANSNLNISGNIVIEKDLPSSIGNWKELIASFEGEGECRIFTSNGFTHTIDPRYPFIFHLCNEGDMKLKLSRYPDIYTNSSHKGEYVEVLHDRKVSVDYVTLTGELKTVSFIVHKPYMAVPLQRGLQYFLYLEYEKGCPCAPNNQWSTFPLDFSARACSLMTISLPRQLSFPQV